MKLKFNRRVYVDREPYYSIQTMPVATLETQKNNTDKQTDSDTMNVEVTPLFPSDSSFVRGINYAPSENMMEVRLKDKEHGEIPYFYPNTSEGLYNSFISSASYGKFYSKNVKYNNGPQRDYGATSNEKQLRNQMEDALTNTTDKLVSEVKNNDPMLFDNNRELFEAVDRRRSDNSVLYVEDNSDILYLTFEFRKAILQSAINLIESNNPSQPEWVADCRDIAEECSDVSTTYMTMTRL